MKIKINDEDNTSQEKISQEKLADEYDSSYIMTIRGPIAIRYDTPEKPKAAVLFAGELSSGWDSPAQDLYQRLGKKLRQDNIMSLHLRYRLPKDIGEAAYDTIAGIRFLENQNIKKIALVGHSLSGAAIIQAATASKKVVTVVTLSAQNIGADSVAKFPPNCSILLIHGETDSVIPAACSQAIFESAHQPKEIVIVQDDHMLNKAAKKVTQVTHNWLLEKLSK